MKFKIKKYKVISRGVSYDFLITTLTVRVKEKVLVRRLKPKS
ncbi:MAG: hypothetical protein Q7K16_02710 [Candidatus Azambacteria bacterium]|nr:hypothetical protein [Candidatus Azambacteria bacterium]